MDKEGGGKWFFVDSQSIYDLHKSNIFDRSMYLYALASNFISER